MKKHLILSILLSVFIPGFSQNGITEDSTTLKTPTGEIYGTLLIPNSAKPVPVALIIAGSGPTDRDGNQPAMKNNSLKMLAEGLYNNGIASLRFDKRGIAKSKGAIKSESELSFETYIEDVRLWADLLKKDKRFSTVNIVGHSEGSLIGMVACEGNSNVTKYISVAGMGVPMNETLKEQLGKQIASHPALKDSCFLYIDRLKKGEKFGNVDPAFLALFRPSVQPYLISAFKYNPQTEIKKLTIPILILQGDTDIQIHVADADLLAAANANARKEIIENMNHVLKNCPGKDLTAQMPTYTTSEIPINGKLVEEIAHFVNGK
jgi:uncharacterized protein